MLVKVFEYVWPVARVVVMVTGDPGWVALGWARVLGVRPRVRGVPRRRGGVVLGRPATASPAPLQRPSPPSPKRPVREDVLGVRVDDPVVVLPPRPRWIPQHLKKHPLCTDHRTEESRPEHWRSRLLKT